MAEERADRLHELAELVHAVARRLGVPADLGSGPCSPVEISVIRHVCKNPGTSAGAAATATLLASSNFSRVLKGLIARGLVRREADDRDARGVRLYPTDLARSNMLQMREAWSRILDGAGVDLDRIELVNDTLARIESDLAAKAFDHGRTRLTESTSDAL